jgi:hypothetical protein
MAPFNRAGTFTGNETMREERGRQENPRFCPYRRFAPEGSNGRKKIKQG